MEVEVHLHVSLAKYLPPDAEKKAVWIKQPPGASVADVIQHFKIPEKFVKLVFVNGVRTSKQAPLSEGDRVGLFPPVGGG